MMTFEQAAYYLAAMIDGEGSVSNTGRLRYNRCIRVANTDPDLIAATMECCNILGIRATVIPMKREPQHRPCWNVIIRDRDSLERALEVVPLRASTKLQKLQDVVASYCERRPDPELLRRLYVDEQMSTLEIGRLIGRPGESVAIWLKKDGVPRRTHSEAAVLRSQRDGIAVKRRK